MDMGPSHCLHASFFDSRLALVWFAAFSLLPSLSLSLCHIFRSTRQRRFTTTPISSTSRRSSHLQVDPTKLEI
ncbi:hypothetical protein PRUPE_8G001700 [Prunus persica]|uniref:Uncharacterized protein n=1 Tax=Prunus persica TaxID=3760 RepID=A0A251MQE1_PRUPE|nr:hypothetical protein PRUPE_8G001700 [Prunus persica]